MLIAAAIRQTNITLNMTKALNLKKKDHICSPNSHHFVKTFICPCNNNGHFIVSKKKYVHFRVQNGH
ncbi:hypothetical protein DERF_006768 [Dermatophagoides farinae]|uniref:Uncharacterized protein n=1 Tax=Dermatophagoides farinae TaxID=6954 RepID=A0A922HXT0_DERFA|nr:hypothetical protein DERF_006768 [Dermatophagoides farinae]